MKLAVIIVNYNVKYFLEQALLSVRKAAVGLSVEIWVVDNNSVDDSVAMVQEKFPEVRLLANKENVGFSKANNQALRATEAEYVLLLNPDTVVQEDTFLKCLNFMDAHPEAGGLGVRTIDGSGTFLPESKRGFPSPWVAFCKAFGLSALFPTSPLFNWYYLGHLPADQTCACEVLVGSFMLMRRSVLDEIGMLDEAFFMYGEDIDLSYRIVKQGYKNYYFADTTIIHYKGESTKKGSLNYVRTFYNAMIIFARKHFEGEKAAVFIALMQGAVWFRAALTLLTGLAKRALWPSIDASFMAAGLIWLKHFWSNYYYKDPDYIKVDFIYINIPIYIIIWLSAIYLSGGYDKPLSLRRILRGVAVGTLFLAAVYGFLESPLRSSRMLLVLGALWTGLSLVASRLGHHFIKNKNFKLGTAGPAHLVIVGSAAEAQRVRHLLAEAQVVRNIIGTVSVEETTAHQIFLGSLRQLAEIVRIYKVQEVIFCAKDVSANDIMSWMSQLGTTVEFRIVPEESLSIIGSSDKNTAGEIYTIDIQFAVAKPLHRRHKRILDGLLCFFLVAVFPLFFLFFYKKKSIYASILAVLSGQKTWVGYTPQYHAHLPKMKPGVLSPIDAFEHKDFNPATIQRLNFLYAKDYDTAKDIDIFFRWLLV